VRSGSYLGLARLKAPLGRRVGQARSKIGQSIAFAAVFLLIASIFPAWTSQAAGSAVQIATTSIAAGGETNCALRSGGAAYCWGDNTYGQFGDGTTTSKNAPSLVSGPYSWASISTKFNAAATMATTCGVTTSGAGYCWGSNNYGQIGDGTTTNRTVPTAVSGGYTWASISVGDFDTCGVTTTGTGYCWGFNGYGEDGTGVTSQNTTPAAVTGSYTWASISAGYAIACGITTSHVAYCWGWNAYGQVGDNSTTTRPSPTAVAGSYSFNSISAGAYDVCGVTTTGVGYCWGYNAVGEVGDGSTTQRPAPTAVSGSYTWTAIMSGTANTCGLTTSGDIYCWGLNNTGEIGNGTTTNSSTPTAIVAGNNKFSSLSVKGNGASGIDGTNCALTTGSVEYCWGNNVKSQIGDRSTTARSKPTAVNWVNVNVATTISSGGRTNCAIRGNGVAYCWGDNSSGQVGDGSTAPRAQPSMVIGGYTWASISTGYNPTTGDATTCGVTTSGAGYCWGSNKAGQVGVDLRAQFLRACARRRSCGSIQSRVPSSPQHIFRPAA
jgi:alpha-tubulin suppressor-like RCC1 family protein